MANTKIEWAEKTWNPVTGCTPISEGCANCYAQRMSKRLAGRCGYPAEEPFRVTTHPKILGKPLRWMKPQNIFVCSMSDLFHPDIPIEFVAEVFNTIASWKLKCRKESCEHDNLDCWHDPKHTYMILTKRPDRIAETFERMLNFVGNYWPGEMPLNIALEVDDWPLSNVWMGVTAENQQRADERIPVLLEIPAAVRFVSVEPMLGPVDIEKYMESECWGDCDCNSLYGYDPGCRKNGGDGTLTRKLDWVICGGETGPGARPMHPDWARSLRDQCRAMGTPFFLKQMHVDGKLVKMPELDGRVWDEMPEPGRGGGE